MMLKFTKMSALGNDFIMVDGAQYSTPQIAPHVVALCDRRFGIGADGVIIVHPAVTSSDFRMQIFNADGSEPYTLNAGSV